MARNSDKLRIRKTPNGLHLYTAAMLGYATYGWGNTREEARAKLGEMIERHGEKRCVGNRPTRAS